MDVTNKKKVIKSLEKNEDDFSLVSVILSQLNLNKVQLMENKLYLVGGRKIITDKKISKNKMFEQYPLIYREEGSATRKAMENLDTTVAILQDISGPKVRVGDLKEPFELRKGDTLTFLKDEIIGYITDEFGKTIKKIVSPKTGVILYMKGTPPTKTGSRLFCISSYKT